MAKTSTPIMATKFLINVINEEDTVKDKFLAFIYYITEPFAGSILLYLGLLLIIIDSII